MDFFNIPSELSKANSPAYKSGLLRLYRNGGCKDCNAKIGIGMYQNAGLAASRIMPMNPQQVQQMVKQNQEPQLTQDQRMRQAISGNINRRSNLSESTHTVQQQFTPEERANAIPQPSGLMQAADIVTDAMQLGNFVPHPAFQTIGRIGNYLGATVDGYQGMQNLVEGDYRNAAINFGGFALPTALEVNSFKRNSKYLRPGQTLYPLSPQGLTKVNPGTMYFPPRTMYLEPFDQVRGMTKSNLLTNRAMLGTLGAETAYDSYGKGGEMIRRADGSYSRRGLWDNIRANRGSGKKPTKEMLKQERKIKAKYQEGGMSSEVPNSGTTIVYRKDDPRLIDYNWHSNSYMSAVDFPSLSKNLNAKNIKYSDNLMSDPNYHELKVCEDCGWDEETVNMWKNNYSGIKGHYYANGTVYYVYDRPEGNVEYREPPKIKNVWGEQIYTPNTNVSNIDAKRKAGTLEDYRYVVETEDGGLVELSNQEQYKKYKEKYGFDGNSLNVKYGRMPQFTTQPVVTTFERGGVIKDDRGQWAHPGKVTQINSPNITMKGVPYPVLGISDAGDTQMMMPNGEYQFAGNKVTEYPIMQNGALKVNTRMIPLSSEDEEVYNQYEKSLQELAQEKSRVNQVRKNVIPAAKKIISDQVKLENEGVSKEYYDYLNAANPQELAKATVNLPPQIKNLLPNQGRYSVAQWNPATNSWKSGASNTRELYCTPYGCFNYQKAGAKDVPIVPGNVGFADMASKGKIPFTKISAKEREPGDMALLVEQAPADYINNPKMVLRPHHTTVFSNPDPSQPNNTEAGYFYNAEAGNRLAYTLGHFNTNMEPNDRIDYYRYIGQIPKFEQNLANVPAMKMPTRVPIGFDVPTYSPQSSQPVDVDVPTYASKPSRRVRLFGKGGYIVRKTNERKGKTHVVIGPNGTKKYFGDPSMGERSKSKYGKEAFYKRHAKNLKSNPYFRAYARATWSDGGIVRDIEPFNLSSY